MRQTSGRRCEVRAERQAGRATSATQKRPICAARVLALSRGPLLGCGPEEADMRRSAQQLRCRAPGEQGADNEAAAKRSPGGGHHAPLWRVNVGQSEQRFVVARPQAASHTGERMGSGRPARSERAQHEHSSGAAQATTATWERLRSRSSDLQSVDALTCRHTLPRRPAVANSGGTAQAARPTAHTLLRRTRVITRPASSAHSVRCGRAAAWPSIVPTRWGLHDLLELG